MRATPILCAGALLALTSAAYSQAYDGYGGQTYGGWGGQTYGQPYSDPYAGVRESFVANWTSAGYDLQPSIPAKGTPDHGFIVPARHIPADPPEPHGLPSSAHYLATIRGDELAIATDPGTYVFWDWAQRVAPRHPHGDTDYRARSCAGFVYKRWYEYSRFEDAVRTCGTDASCVYMIGTMWSSPGIASRPQLFQKAPGIHTIPKPLTPASQDVAPGAIFFPYDVKNEFFRVAPATILRASTQYDLDPTFASDTEELLPIVGTPPLHDQTDKMAWHKRMAAAQEEHLDLLPVERKDIGRRLTQYKRLVAEYRKLRALLPEGEIPSLPPGVTGGTGTSTSGWLSTVSFLGGTDAGPAMIVPTEPTALETPLSPEIVTAIAYQAVVDEMADMLMYEWRHKDVKDPYRLAVDHGCLVGIACDWSFEQFATDYVGRFQSEREGDMHRCLQATSDVIPADAPWAADVVTMDAYINTRINALKLVVASLPFAPISSADTARGSRTIHWGITPVNESKGLKDYLHAHYEHHADAEVSINFDDEKICSVQARVDAGIEAGYTAPDASYMPDSHKLIDGKLQMSVARDGVAFSAYVYLLIDDHELIKLNPTITDESTPWAPPPQSSHFDIYDYHVPFSILGVPAFLSVAVQGDLTFKPSIRVPAFDPACRVALGAQPILPVIEALLDTSVDVDADGRLGIGIPGFSFGVNGHVDVLTASVPAKARFEVTAPAGVPHLNLEASARLDAVLMGGSLSVYAEALFVYAEKSIFGWDGIPVGFDLWKTNTSLPLTFLGTAFKPASAAPLSPGGDDL